MGFFSFLIVCIGLIVKAAEGLIALCGAAFGLLWKGLGKIVGMTWERK